MFDSFIVVGPTSGGTWVVGDHERFLTDFPCHAGGVTYGYHKTNESDYYECGRSRGGLFRMTSKAFSILLEEILYYFAIPPIGKAG